MCVGGALCFPEPTARRCGFVDDGIAAGTFVAMPSRQSFA